MRAWPTLLLVAIASSCSLWPDGQFPPGGGERIDERPEFLMWWKLVEACSHTRRHMDVKWFTTNGRYIDYGDVMARGVYRPWPDRIALADPNNGSVARHEILHALLGGDGHPLDQFGIACEGFVNFTPPDSLGISAKELAEAVTVRSDSALSVTVATYPEKPSQSAFGGKYVFIITAMNRTGRSIWTNIPNRNVFVQYNNASGVQFQSEVLPYARVFFRAGQSRRMLIDATVQLPGTFELFAGYGRAVSAPQQLILQK